MAKCNERALGKIPQNTTCLIINASFFADACETFLRFFSLRCLCVLCVSAVKEEDSPQRRRGRRGSAEKIKNATMDRCGNGCRRKNRLRRMFAARCDSLRN